MRTIIDVSTKETYEIEPRKSGENPMPCPACADHHPKNAKRKCFSWNDQKKTGRCHRCEASFVEFRPKVRETVYIKPDFNDQTKLSDDHLKYFHGRMISNEALNKGGVYSGRQFMPQLEKEVPVVCFPFFDQGELINVKYRGPKKSFRLVKGAKKIFYNLDNCKNSNVVVIVEGEIDALSYLTCGINFVLSVPNGANKNLDYLNDCIELFDEKESVILAVDQDTKGFELREELARRIGQEKCKIVDFKDCKDANEYLVKYGAPALFQTLEDAHDYPVSGVFAANDFQDSVNSLWVHGPKPGKKIGVDSIDSHISWETGRLAIFTGIPGHGKSEFLDFIITKLNLYHGWKVGYFSPENHPLALHYSKIAEKLTGMEFKSEKMPRSVFNQVFMHIRDNYYFIYPEEDVNIDSVLSKAKYLVKKYGIRMLVIDPFNRLDHQYQGQTQTDYISSFLDKLANFALMNGVLIFLVAHPAKMPKEGGMMQVPNLYSISGSSNFYNKADFGVTVYRLSDKNGLINQTEVHVQKVKFKHLGKTGKIDLVYNYRNGRFEEETPAGINGWDNSNWLDKMIAEETELPF